jgi:DNA-binding MarR family transcriptional regulator
MATPAQAAAPESLSGFWGQLEDLPYLDAGSALVKAGFLFSNRPGAPYRAYGLNLGQVDVLVAIARADETELSCSEIAERTVITKGGITKILDRLEERRLIRRVPSRQDGRSVSIQLTAKGADLCRKLTSEAARSARETFENAFRPEQMKQFSKMLVLLVHSLEVDKRKSTNARKASEPPR